MEATDLSNANLLPAPDAEPQAVPFDALFASILPLKPTWDDYTFKLTSDEFEGLKWCMEQAFTD